MIRYEQSHHSLPTPGLSSFKEWSMSEWAGFGTIDVTTNDGIVERAETWYVRFLLESLDKEAILALSPISERDDEKIQELLALEEEGLIDLFIER